MPINVRIPTPLRKLTQDKDIVQASGATIQDIIDSLEKQYPGLKERICDERGELRRFVNVYLNDEDMAKKMKPAKVGKETKRLWLTYPKKVIQQPAIYELGHKFQVVTNIRQA